MSTTSAICDTHKETIICPNCNKTQEAVVVHTIPWYTYIHICDCGYTITESDWDKVNTEEAEGRL